MGENQYRRLFLGLLPKQASDKQAQARARVSSGHHRRRDGSQYNLPRGDWQNSILDEEFAMECGSSPGAGGTRFGLRRFVPRHTSATVPSRLDERTIELGRFAGGHSTRGCDKKTSIWRLGNVCIRVEERLLGFFIVFAQKCKGLQNRPALSIHSNPNRGNKIANRSSLEMPRGEKGTYPGYSHTKSPKKTPMKISRDRRTAVDGCSLSCRRATEFQASFPRSQALEGRRHLRRTEQSNHRVPP